MHEKTKKDKLVMDMAIHDLRNPINSIEQALRNISENH